MHKQVSILYRSLFTMIDRKQYCCWCVTLLSAPAAQHWTTEPKRIYTSSSFKTHFYTICTILQSNGKNSFLSYLGFRQKYLEVPQTPLVGFQRSSAKGKQAILLESLFKESDSQLVPPLLTPANRESALSPTKTSQTRPFLHTRQKNAQGCSSLLPQTLQGMFGKRAEMTGTTIRLPYLEKMA